MPDVSKITKEQYENIVYVSCDLDESCQYNKSMFEKLLLRLREKFPTYLFISPLHAEYGDDKSYSEKYRLFLLENCADEMWYLGKTDNSTDILKNEISYCDKNGIIYKDIREVIG